MEGFRHFAAKESIDGNRTSHSPWKVLLDKPLRNKAIAASLWVAEHLQDPEYVQQVAILAKEQSSSPQWNHSHPWAAAELALFYWHVACCFPKQDWQTVAQRYLKLVAIRSQQQNLTSPGLFGGISGVALVIQHFSKAGQHYLQTLARLHQSIAEQVSRRSSWRLPPKAGIAETDMDLITGAAGIAGYLASVPTPDLVVHDTLHTLLDYLLALTEPGQALGKERWFSPPSLLITEQARQDYPCGRFNCGLAHGIAGPLAALSLVAMAGYDAPAYLNRLLM
ncbi:MAG TPA: lanthionine synthetase LanC family protein [Ktedonobacteraceae bacterium]|nr:lanthionine synthetase LanC family protein [Ktedonobacteraceae bacterium]